MTNTPHAEKGNRMYHNPHSLPAFPFLFPLFLLSFSLLTIGCRSLSGFTMIENISYVPEGTNRQTGDLYLPGTPGPHPAAVVLHGGGWSGRDQSDMTDISKRLAANGIAAFNVNYRLAPENRFPAQLEDTRSALRWLVKHADTHTLDPERLYTVGYSAGAHLALLAATDPHPDAPDIQAVIAGGAPTDLTLYPESPYVKKLMGVSYENEPESYIRASPLHQVSPSHPPVFLYHGRLDRIVYHKNSRLLKEALEAHDVQVQLFTRPILGHILTYFWEGAAIDRGIAYIQALDE
jgi:acetyl esterase/lipase